MEFNKIDKKWQAKWDKAKLNEANPSDDKKFFTSMVVPYVNGSPHIGHSYTYTRTDAYARFKRMQQYNVLLAQGWHATGEPILGTIERLKKGDKNQEETLLAFGATKKDLDDFVKKGPKYAAEFWTKKFEAVFRSMGYSIDWRRAFTLSVTPQFSRFVEWQYNTLRKKGYVAQGTHPVVWCPKDLSPTGDHDRLSGVGESPAEYTILKFKYDDYILPAATLRPETIYGVTNIWINPEAEYVAAEVDGEKWIVSKEAAAKLKDQLKNLGTLHPFDVKKLIGDDATEPIRDRPIPILPSSFVDPKNATGVVMSVPAHAPFDWIALKELKEKYNADHIKPIGVIKVEGYGHHPAVEICERMNITNLSQSDKLEEATSVIYKKEFHTGTIAIGDYTGLKVSESKEKLTNDFIKQGIADHLWEVNDVVCRCTTRCHVKILENQWFLKYSDEAWKQEVRKCLAGMKIYPDEARNNFLSTIDWLKDKACARKSGLGTPLPWDREWLVETLSDSTIYMAYYTIAHIANKISPEKLTDEVFDYVFLGRGDPKKIKLGNKLKQMRKEFEYFYPIDIRNSAKDLVQNHLTFFLYHHTAIFPQNRWPKGISVNGYVNVEGEKMSKSKGNIIPLADLIQKYGADLVRINITASGQGIDDADWQEDTIRSYKNRFDFLIQSINDLKSAKKTTTESIDFYLQSRLQKHIEDTTGSYETLMFRDAVQSALFESTNDIKWYLRRTKKLNKKIMKDYLESVVKLIAPITPHISEEMWKMLGHKGFVVEEEWPKADPTHRHLESELGEELLKKTLADAEEVKNIVKINPKKITLFVAENWKFRVYNTVLKNKDKNVNDITKEIMSSGSYGKATVAYIQSLYKKIGELQPCLPRMVQLSLLAESKEFLEKETGCTIVIEDAEKSENAKAKSAAPNKFGIFME